MRQRVTSLQDLERLKLGPKVQIQKSGGFFTARYEGRADFAFGTTHQEAEQKLRSGRLQRAREQSR